MMLLLRKMYFVVLIFNVSLPFVVTSSSDDPDDPDAGVLGFTYGDNDPMGPFFWKKNTGHGRKGGSNLKRNRCQDNWLSPMNIRTKRVIAPDLGKVVADIAEGARHMGTGDTYSETLIISLTGTDIEKESWEFSHPSDKYHGIEIRPMSFGLVHTLDNFDPLDKTDPYATYDFHFLTVFYCDFDKSSPRRSMHQIDGKRFPVELHFVFIRSIKEGTSINGDVGEAAAHIKMAAKKEELTIPVDPETELIDENNIAVVVTVLVELGKRDNKYFEPIAEAARNFYGRDFGVDAIDDRAVVQISSPWSPTWLLPDNSDYYYYDDGSFPVPPCWKVARYYIFRERLKISNSQLQALTSVSTERERHNSLRLPCTYSLLQHEILSGEVTVNLIEYEFKGDDKKPRSPYEVKLWKMRKKKAKDFRNRLTGKTVSLDTNNDNDNGARCNKMKTVSFLSILIVLAYSIFSLYN